MLNGGEENWRARRGSTLLPSHSPARVQHTENTLQGQMYNLHLDLSHTVICAKIWAKYILHTKPAYSENILFLFAAQPIPDKLSAVKGVAKFDFTAESEDELTLKVFVSKYFVVSR